MCEVERYGCEAAAFDCSKTLGSPGFRFLDPIARGRYPLLQSLALAAGESAEGGREPSVISFLAISITEPSVGTKKTGKGRRKLGRKKRRMRSKIRHRK